MLMVFAEANGQLINEGKISHSKVRESVSNNISELLVSSYSTHNIQCKYKGEVYFITHEESESHTEIVRVMKDNKELDLHQFDRDALETFCDVLMTLSH